MGKKIERFIKKIDHGIQSNISSILIIISCVLFFRLGFAIYRYGVNLFMHDAWARNLGFIKDQTFFSLFFQQDAGMIQGPSYILTYWLAHITNFDARAEYWHSFVYLALACWCLWRILKKKYPLSIVDMLVPLIIFTVRDHDTLFKNASASYGAFPIFLVMLFCYVSIWNWGWHRVIISGITLLFLLYSGYGYLALPACFLYLILEYFLVQSSSKKNYVLLLMIWLVGISAVYLTNFDFSLLVDYPKQTAYQFSVSQLGAYGVHFFGYHMVRIPYLLQAQSDYVWFFLCAAAYGGGIVMFLKRKASFYFIPLICMTYTVLFVVANAFGRVSIGVSAAEAFRYEMHLIPFFIGVFFLLKQMKQRVWKVLVFCLFLSTMIYREFSYALIVPQGYPKNVVGVQKEFKICVQQGQAVDGCEKNAGVDIFLDAYGHRLTEKPEYAAFLQYLKERKANLYAPDRKYPY